MVVLVTQDATGEHVLPQGRACTLRVAVGDILVDPGNRHVFGGPEPRPAEMHERLDDLRSGAPHADDEPAHVRQLLPGIAET